jgi:hypothetical protein
VCVCVCHAGRAANGPEAERGWSSAQARLLMRGARSRATAEGQEHFECLCCICIDFCVLQTFRRRQADPEQFKMKSYLQKEMLM